MVHTPTGDIIDLEGLRKLKEAIDRNISAANEGVGKKLIVVIGATRVGKSTTIAILTNKKIVKKTVEGTKNVLGKMVKSKQIVYDVEDKGNDNPVIGHKKFEACTDTMSFFSCSNSEYILVDTAGLFDTNGTISEIAHKAAFDHILKHAESIKPLMLINYEEFSGSGNSIKSLIKIASSIFNNSEEKLEKSLVICLTHVPKQRDDISDRFVAMFETTESLLLGKAIGWLNDNNPKFQIIEDPTSFNGDELWKVIEAAEPLIPKEIDYELEQNSNNEFIKSMESLKNNMIVWIETRNFDSIISTITILESLNKHIPDLVGSCFKFAIEKISNSIIKEHQNAINTINIILNRKMCGDNEIKSLNNFFSLIDCSKNFRNLGFNLPKELYEVDKFENWLIEALNNFESLIQLDDKTNLAEINWTRNVHPILEVLCCLSELKCEEIKQIYEKNCEQITKYLQNHTDGLKTKFQDITFFSDINNINHLSTTLDCLNESSSIVKFMVNNYNQQNEINELKNKFASIIQKSHEDLKEKLKDLGSCDLSYLNISLTEIKEIFHANKLISERHELFEYFGENQCKKYLEIANQYLEVSITEYLETLKPYTVSINSDSTSIKNLKLYSKICDELIKMSNNTKFARMLIPSFSSSKSYIKKLSSELESTILLIENGNTSVNIIQAANLLKKLHKLILFDEMNSNTYVSKKYEHCKNLIFLKIENIIVSLENYWKLNLFAKFNEIMGHIKRLQNANVFSKIKYEKKNIYDVQKNIYIQDISNFCNNLINFSENQINLKYINDSLRLLDEYKNNLLEFSMEIQQLITKTELSVSTKIEELIQEKLNILNQQRSEIIDSKKSEENSAKFENILEALNFLQSCCSFAILQGKLSKQNYYEEGKRPIKGTLDEIKNNFDTHVKNSEFVKAREYYELFQIYCNKLGYPHFPSIFQQCGELRNQLNTETNNTIREIENMIEKNQFRKIKKAFQNIIEDSNKQKIIEQIIDFLNDYYTKKLSHFNTFEPVIATNENKTNILVTIGNSDSMEEEVKQIATFANHLNFNSAIEKILKEYDNKLKLKFKEIFTKNLENMENQYIKYYVSTCNCIGDHLKKSFLKIQTHINISELEIPKKIDDLKGKYEERLFLDLKDALTNDRSSLFKEIWDASITVPKRSFSESDEILAKVTKEIESYYSTKMQECRDSNSVKELEKTIQQLQSMDKFPEFIINQLKTKISTLTSQLSVVKEDFNRSLIINDYENAKSVLSHNKYLDKQLYKELVRNAQEHFDQQIKIVKSKFNNNDYMFSDDLRQVCTCKDTIGQEIKLNKFDELIQELTSNLNKLVRIIQNSMENNEINNLATNVEVFIRLCVNIESVESVQKNKLDCFESIRNYYTECQNKLKDAQQHVKIPIINDCLKILEKSQSLFTMILSEGERLSIPQEFTSLLKNLHVTKIQEMIASFLDDQYRFFEDGKKNQDFYAISEHGALLHEIPQNLSWFNEEKTAKFNEFKSSLILEIKQIDNRKITELWEQSLYQQIEDTLKFIDQVSPVINYFSIEVPNFEANLCVLVRKVFNQMNNDADECALSFIKYREIAEFIRCLRKPIIEEITKKTTNFSKQYDILSLYTALRNCGNSSNTYSIVVEYILDECPNFKSFVYKLINAHRKTFTSGNTLQKILQSKDDDSKYSQLNPKEIEELQKLYDTCDKIYNDLLEKHLGSPNFTSIINTVKTCIKNNPKKYLAEIVANIFALWSLTNSELEFISKTQDSDYFKKPHPVQMISIFMLLSFNKPSKHFENQLIEIRTGEGKSITLGVCAIIFALMGYQADVVCYSKILSSRDEIDFRNLFDHFGVTSRINYNTIDNLCENIINEGGKLRDTVNNFVKTNKSDTNTYQNNQPNLPRVCLIDEVDEFCSKLFLGKTYTPTSIILDEDFFDIVALVWNRRHSNYKLSLYDIKKESAYNALISKYPNITFIFDLQIQELLNDVRNFDDPELPESYFDVSASKIGYKHHDEIDYGIYLKHKTTFQYFDKFERQQISKAVLKKRIGFYICCGRFSFAEIPKQYNYLLGLTGTLNLHPTQIQIVKNQYKINTFTKMPSMYGESELKFDSRDDLSMLSNLDEYYKKLQTEIEIALNNKRAILVFFENEARLNSFKQSPYCPESCNVIVESSMDKNRLFRKATISNTCTLLTKVFGRGTDFSVKDKDVINNNGVLVIQTFFSDSFSEEIQIKGRTARQGSKGQFMIILLKNDIIKLFDLTNNENIIVAFASANQLYDQLDTWRKNKITNDLEPLTLEIADALELHNISKQFKNSLSNGISNAEALWKSLNFINASFSTVGPLKPYNIIMALDESGSMSSAWGSLIIAVQEFIKSRIEKCSDMRVICNDVITIMCYDHRVRIAVKQTTLSNPKLLKKVEKIEMRAGGTAFGPAITAANFEFETSDLNVFTPVFVFMTDGQSKCGDKEMVELKQKYEQCNIKIFVIGFGDPNKQRLERLAELGDTTAVFGKTGELLKEEFVRVSAKISAVGPLKQ